MSESAFHRRDSELDPYLAEIQEVPLLNAQEERDLALRMQKRNSPEAGDRRDARDARERFTQANLRLVVSIARGFLNRGLPLADLVAEGNLGLLRAVEGFDLRKKCRFSTYATWWIRQAIHRALVNTVKTVRVPSYMAEIVAKWKNAENEASQRLGRKPENGEVGGEDAGRPRRTERLRRAMDAAARCARPISLDAAQTAQEVPDRTESSSPEEALRSRSDLEELHALLRTMGEREAAILRFRFGLYDGKPLTLGAVGRRLRITRERVRQLEKAALEKLQTRLVASMEGRRRGA